MAGVSVESGGSSLSLRDAIWVTLAALLLGLPSLSYPWSWRDNGALVYMGATILNGGAIYRDAWNIKAPGVDFFGALSILLFGQSAFALRLLDLIWQLATALVVALLSVRIYRHATPGLVAACLYLLFYFAQNFEFWAQPDGLLQLPLALSVLSFLHAEERDRFRQWALAGASVGIAALFKLVMGVFGVALLVAAITREGRPADRAVRRPAALALGFAAPFAAMAVYLLWKGSLVDFLVTQFTFAPEFAAYERRITTRAMIEGSFLRPVLASLYAMVVAALFSFPVLRRGDNQGLRAAMVLWAWVAAGGMALIMHGSFLGYHFLAVASALAILSSGPVHRLIQKAQAERSIVSALSAGFLALALAVPVVAISRRYRHAWEEIHGREPDEPLQACRMLGVYLHAHTSAADRIFVWGDGPVIYLLAGRKSASRFLSTAFLSIPWRSVDFRPIFLEDFSAHRPAYFVFIRGKSRERELQEMPALKRIVDDEYALEKEDAQFRIFRRKTQASNTGPRG
jgi:4-amino-4-deoxy-L-arabinose transferase-like glycosyltransferase